MKTIEDVIQEAGVQAMRDIWLTKYVEVLKKQFEKNAGNGYPSAWTQSVVDSIQIGEIVFDSSTYDITGSIKIMGQEYVVARATVIDEGNQHNGPLMIRPNETVWNHEFNALKQNEPVVHVKQFSQYQRRKKTENGSYYKINDEYVYETVEGHGTRKHSSQSLSAMQSKRRQTQLKKKKDNPNQKVYNTPTTGYLAFRHSVPMPAGMNHDGLHIINNAFTIINGISGNLMSQTQTFIHNEVLHWYQDLLGIKR